MRVAALFMIVASVSGWLAPVPERLSSRRAAVAGLAAAVTLPGTAAFADSKYDKAFDNCLSKCVYEKTKITKGIGQVRTFLFSQAQSMVVVARIRPPPPLGQVEVVSRADAFKECKPKVGG